MSKREKEIDRGNVYVKKTKKVKKIILGIFLGIAALFIVTVAISVNSSPKNNTLTTVSSQNNFVLDANQFSRISVDELKSKFREPKSTEDWMFKTATENNPVTTYTYEKDNITYEFITYENIVVKANIYSEKYWKGSGDNFKFDNIDNITKLFTEEKGPHAHATYTGNVYRVDSLNNKIAILKIINIENKEFGGAQITFDTRPFE